MEEYQTYLDEDQPLKLIVKKTSPVRNKEESSNLQNEDQLKISSPLEESKRTEGVIFNNNGFTLSTLSPSESKMCEKEHEDDDSSANTNSFCVNCSREISSHHICLHPTYRKQFDSAGNLKLLKTKSYLRLKQSNFYQCFNKSFLEEFGVKFLVLIQDNIMRIKPQLLRENPSLTSYKFSICQLQNVERGLSIVGHFDDTVAEMDLGNFKNESFVIFKIVIYIGEIKP